MSVSLNFCIAWHRTKLRWYQSPLLFTRPGIFILYLCCYFNSMILENPDRWLKVSQLFTQRTLPHWNLLVVFAGIKIWTDTSSVPIIRPHKQTNGKTGIYY